jgi:hypothetical protein
MLRSSQFYSWFAFAFAKFCFAALPFALLAVLVLVLVLVLFYSDPAAAVGNSNIKRAAQGDRKKKEEKIGGCSCGAELA